MSVAIAIFVFLNQWKKSLSIISMLAAIGTPVLLNQRKKAVDASLKSDLHRHWLGGVAGGECCLRVTSIGGSSGELWHGSDKGGLQPSGTGCTT